MLLAPHAHNIENITLYGKERIPILTLLPYWIVCPLVGIAGFVDAIAGGGGLIALPAYLIAGVPVHTAIATNKISSAMGMTAATLRYARSGYIHWKQCLICLPFALMGAVAGAKLTFLISARMFTIFMLAVVPFAAWYVLRSHNLQRERKREKDPFSPRKTILRSIPIVLLLGAYDGFYGPGTGTFLLLFFTGVAHMSLHSAAGVTKVLTLTTNLAALVVFLWSGTPELLLGIVAGCFGVLGNYIGAKLFTETGARWIKPLILTVLAIFFVKLCAELFF